MATRFYLPSSGAAAVSPAYDAGWEDTSIAARLRTSTSKQSTAMTTVAFTDANDSNKDILFRQYVSDPIQAITITAQTIKFQIRGLEDNSGANLFSTLGVRVVSNDGSTVRGTVLAVTRDDTQLSSLATTNRQFTATSTEVIAEDSDRIVIEIGTGGNPNSLIPHDSSLRIGDADASDLPEDDTSTSDFNPWFEFTTTTFINAYDITAETGAFTLTGIDAGVIAQRKLDANTGFVLDLNGTNEYLSKSSPTIDLSGDFTILAEVLSTAAAGTYHPFFSIDDGSELLFELAKTTNNGNTRVTIRDGVDTVDIQVSDTTLGDGVRHLVAASVDRDGNVVLTRDGVSIGSASMSAIGTLSPTRIVVGARLLASGFFPGKIGRVCVVTGVAIDTATILTYYQNGVPASEVIEKISGATVAAYFDWEGADATAALSDKSGTGNNLTGTNVDLTDRFTSSFPARGYEFVYTGVDAGLTAQRVVVAGVGAFTLTGIDAELRFWKLTAETGAFTLTGIDAGLTAARTMEAATGYYYLTGINADLSISRRFFNTKFSLNGPGFKVNDLLIAQKVDYDVDHNSVTLMRIEAKVIEIVSGGEAVVQITDGWEYVSQWKKEIEFVCVGNTTDTDRQGHILMTASDTNAPYLQIASGVTSLNSALSNGFGNVATIKARLGRLDGITDDNFGALTGFGIYTNSGYFKGSVAVGSATAIFTGTGVWLDSGGSFRAGNPAGSYIYWNQGTGSLDVRGTITVTGGNAQTTTATSGTIAGMTISSTALTAASGGNTTIVSSGATAFSAGPTGSPTVTITQAGILTATGATIKSSTGTKRIEIRSSDNEMEFLSGGESVVRVGDNVTGTVPGVFIGDDGAQAGALVVGSTSSIRTVIQDNSINISNGEVGLLSPATLTATRSWTFPDQTGTILAGTVNATSPTSPNRTITVNIGGTTYYIHAKTTND